MKTCHLCRETKDLEEWRHPETGVAYVFCGYCLESIIGVCAGCGEVLSKLNPIRINRMGEKICHRCGNGLAQAEEDEYDD